MIPEKPQPTPLQYLFGIALIVGCGGFIAWIVSTCVNDFMLLKSVDGIPKILYSSLLIFLAGYVAFHQFIAITHFVPALKNVQTEILF